ncbi:hypothetical protein RI129_002275 [Pyrocoelia pectoralis]|uniref:Sodium channel protein Nach n=1 Tax=Pyrocoelia pectoralis TaxID=417401 RepID=A0AAN7VLX7_9COLE
MVKVRAKRNRIINAISRTYTEFADNTSIHGFKYTVGKDNNFLERVVWICIIALGLIGSGIMFNLFWERYSSTPTRTILKTNYLPNIELHFPAITICPFSNTMISKYKSNLNDSEKAYARRVFPYILTNSSETKLMQDSLFDPITIIRKMSQNCTEFLQKCSWEGRHVNCADIFNELSTPFGLCYSFNYNTTKIRHTPYFGYRMGLSVLINSDLRNHFTNKVSKGIETIIHDPTQYPYYGDLTRIVTVGSEVFMQLSGQRYICGKDVQGMPKQLNRYIAANEKRLKFFSHYTGRNCLTEYNVQTIMERCKCYEYFYTFTVKGEVLCHITSIVYEPIETLNKSHCPLVCELTNYNALVTHTKLIISPYVSSPFLRNVTVQDDSILLHAFYYDQTQTMYTTKAVTSVIYLLSSLGGIFSFFLGCSFISVLEIIYYVFIKFYLNLKSYNRVEQSTNMRNTKCSKKTVSNVKHIKVYTMYRGEYLE